MSISRSRGYQVGPYNPGGGYEGATKELDRSVQRDAKWLAQNFPGYDVEIRFNTDRQSGGAFLRIDEGLRALESRSVGLGTAITSEGYADHHRDEFAVGALRHEVVISNSLLKSPDSSIVDEPDFVNLAEVPDFKTAAGARSWLLRNIDRTKIPSPSNGQVSLRSE